MDGVEWEGRGELDLDLTLNSDFGFRILDVKLVLVGDFECKRLAGQHFKYGMPLGSQIGDIQVGR